MPDLEPADCTCHGPVLLRRGHQKGCPWYGIPYDRRSRPRRTKEQRDEDDLQVIEKYEDDARAEGLRQRNERKD